MYVELHARSAFSFLESSSLPEDLIATCANLNMSAMALLDRNGVYGAPRFHMAAKKAGVKAHIGAEVSCEEFPISNFQFPIQNSLRPKIGNRKLEIGNSSRLPLLVSSRTGYQNLCRLITKMKLRAPRKEEGAVHEEELREHADGLICLTGGDDGLLAAALAHGGIEEARRAVERLTGIFGEGNVYVELQRHREREEEWRNQAAIRIARSLKLPVLATNGVRYATAYDREILDLFTAVHHHTELDHAGRLLSLNSQRYLRAARVMAALFRDVPEAIANTVDLSSRLKFELNDLGYEFPRYPVPDGETMDSFLRKRVAEGVLRRYSAKNNPYLLERAKKQVEHELSPHRA